MPCRYIFLFLCLIGFALPLQQLSALGGGDSHVKVELIQENTSFKPGQPFWVAVRLEIENEWHVYWKNPGEAGMPLKVEWTLPPGFEAGPLQWPFPEKFTVADMVGFGYNGEVVLLTLITPPANDSSSTEAFLQAHVKWLVCSAMNCQPGSTFATLPIIRKEETPQQQSSVTSLFKQARAKMPQTHIAIKTSRKEGIVQLEFPQEGTSQETIQGVYFFPEQKDVIDEKVDPTVVKTPVDSNRYLVNLKGSDEIGAKSQTLKGVLVLHTHNGVREKVQAIDIDSPIQETQESNLISFLDPSSSVAIGHTIPEDSFASQGRLGWALLFAFMGGVLLNLMPCVLPVMSFKIMGFVKMAGQSRALTLRHGLLFCAGVVASFWLLASIILALRAYGQTVGWGFQLQEPLFVVILATLLFIFALSLFSVFEWGLSVASWAGETQAENAHSTSEYVGSFLSGILATAVATPCTGPFLGSAVGYAVTLPAPQALLIFTSLACGMCSPYLLLAAFPSYLRFIPKPGAWMETFKQLMGFVLLLTVLWLLWVFSAQTNLLSLFSLLGAFLCFSFAAWIYGKGSSPVNSRNKRRGAYVLTALFLLIGCQAIWSQHDTWNQVSLTSEGKVADQWDGWEVFSPERVAELREQGTPVLVDFTAKWCLICQANHLVFSSTEVNRQLEAAGVVKMRADWTKNDPVITQELSKFGRNSVPLYVIYGSQKEQEPLILPQVLTPDIVLNHLNTLLAPEEEIALE